MPALQRVETRRMLGELPYLQDEVEVHVATRRNRVRG